MEVLEANCSEFIPEYHKRNIKLKIMLTSLVVVLPSLANKPKYQNGNSYQRKTAQCPTDDRCSGSFRAIASRRYSARRRRWCR